MPEMKTPGNSGWIAHGGPDSAAAVAFYKQVVGWQMGDLAPEGSEPFPGIMLEDGPIGHFSPQPQPDAGWTIYFTVTDVDASVDRAIKGGAQVISPLMDMPGVGRMATLKDPQGASFALITYESMQS
ncbi:MAG: VOC family protein [Burkholderiaceae bacterium]